MNDLTGEHEFRECETSDEGLCEECRIDIMNAAEEDYYEAKVEYKRYDSQR